MVLERTLESPLDCKEIQPVHPKGDQSCVFIGRTDPEPAKSLQMVIAAMKLKDTYSWKEGYNQLRQHIKKQRHYFANKGPSGQGYGFSTGRVWM